MKPLLSLLFGALAWNVAAADMTEIRYRDQEADQTAYTDRKSVV